MLKPNETLIGKDSAAEYSPDLPTEVPVEHPLTGVWQWDNSQNGFHVSLVHFTSDPLKRTPEFVTESKRGISLADWNREYDIRWQSFKGKPVYEEDFKRSVHVAKTPLVALSHLPIVRGWDFGLYPACIYAQLWPGMRLVVLRELCEKGMGMERFLEEVKAKTFEWFPRHRKFFEVVDPAGFQRVQTDERTVVGLMREAKLDVIPGIQTPATRFNKVRGFLSRMVRGEPAFQLDPSCKMLIQGFDGGYHYMYNNSGQLRDKPEKNDYSHPHDGLQYICTQILNLNLSDTPAPPITQPTYGFSKGHALKA